MNIYHVTLKGMHGIKVGIGLKAESQEQAEAAAMYSLPDQFRPKFKVHKVTLIQRTGNVKPVKRKRVIK